MKRDKATQKWTLALYQDRTRLACVALATLLACCLTGLRAPLVSTLPLLVLAPFLCRLWYAHTGRILLCAAVNGAACGFFGGTASSALLLALFSLLGAAFGCASALVLRLARSRPQAALRILLSAAGIVLLLVPGYASLNLYGNPVGWVQTALRAASYVRANYPDDGLVLTGVEFDSARGTHQAQFSCPLNGAAGAVTLSFDRRGNPVDGYQAMLGEQFCSEQSQRVEAVLADAALGALRVRARAEQPLGLTRSDLEQPYRALSSGREEARERREKARAQLCYTVSLGEFEGEYRTVGRAELLGLAESFERVLSGQSLPYQTVALIAADASGNLARVEFSPGADSGEIETSYRPYKPEEN